MKNQINAKRLVTLRADYERAYSEGEPCLSNWNEKNGDELLALEAWEQDHSFVVPLPIEPKFIIAYSTGTQNKLTDYWEVTDTKEAAISRYQEVLKLPNLCIASVFGDCVVSTDYDHKVDFE